jgi:hypothetical protein
MFNMSKKTKFFTPRWIISAIILFCSVTGHTQNLTSVQADRLFKAGQLWGHLTYFHPFLQYKKVAFDSAYAAVVPSLLAAESDTDFSNALNTWLRILNDPITFAEIKPQTDVKEAFEGNIKTKDGIGIVTLSGGLSDWDKALNVLGSLADSISTLKDLVVDCRDLTEDIGWMFGYSGFQNQLFRGSITTLGARSIAHSGFKPEAGSTSGDYSTYFRDYSPTTIAGSSDHDITVVFVTSNKTALPDVAWAMRKAGKALVISDAQLSDKQNAVSYNISDAVTVNFRIKETLTSSTNADFVIESKDKKVLIDKALELLTKNTFKPQTSTNNLGLELVEKNPHYPNEFYPSIGYRALAVAKIYSVINTFFPNKKLMTVDWDSVTKVYLPSIVLAKDSAEYQLGVSALYAHIQDGHGFIGGSLVNKIIMGGREAGPIIAQVVEDKYVVTGIVNDSLAKSLDLVKGDRIAKRDGKDVFEWINKLKKYKGYSNEVTGTANASNLICRGADQQTGSFTVQKKDGKIINITMPFDKKWTQTFFDLNSGRSHEKVLRFLTPDIGYADLDRLASEAVDSMFEMFKNTKSIIFDMRGYPKGTAWSIAPRLTDKKHVGAAKFTRLDVDFPLIISDASDIRSSETWTNFIQTIPSPDPSKPTYRGKTVMLINENTQSQAEHTGLFFRAANGTKFVGSQTAGANGDVTNFTVPGGLTLSFSGQTVWFPDGTQLQRTGLKPDVFVRPTVKGIQSGKDEVLERAIMFLQNGKKPK